MVAGFSWGGHMSRCAEVSRLALSVVLSACMVASSVPVPALAEAAEIASGGGWLAGS